MSTNSLKKLKPIVNKPVISANSNKLASQQSKVFYRGSRSPTRNGKKDVNSQLEVAFEKYEKIMDTILKTPPDSPHYSEDESDEESSVDEESDKKVTEKDNIEKSVQGSYEVMDKIEIKESIENKIDPNELPQDTETTSPISTEDIDFTPNDDEFCTHKNVTKDKHNTTICEDCGMELYQEISHEQDWRYYGDQDSRNSSDPSRCQYRKCSEKGIKKDLEKMQFPPEICELADKLYLEVTQGDVKRNLLRKGIMFACVFESYKIKHKTKTPDEIQGKFGIDNKSMSQGISYYRLRCPREHFQHEDVDAKHFIPEILKKFNTKDYHVNKVIMLYEKIKDACVVLHRSNPKSVSKALVYYYLRRKGCVIDPVKYGKIVSLSEAITIRLSSEISRVLGTQQSVNLF